MPRVDEIAPYLQPEAHTAVNLAIALWENAQLRGQIVMMHQAQFEGDDTDTKPDDDVGGVAAPVDPSPDAGAPSAAEAERVGASNG